MWDILSKILNVVLGLLTVYFYFESRKLKGFKIDKNLTIKKLELRKVRKEYEIENLRLIEDINKKGALFSGGKIKAEQNLKECYDIRINKIEAGISYLEKLKKYKWLFSK